MTSCYDVQQNQTASFKDIVYRNNNNNDPGSAEERTQFCLLVSSSNIEPDYLSELYIYTLSMAFCTEVSLVVGLSSCCRRHSFL